MNLLILFTIPLSLSNAVSILFYRDTNCRSTYSGLGCHRIAAKQCCIARAPPWSSVRFVRHDGWFLHGLDHHHIGTAYNATSESEHCGTPIGKKKKCLRGNHLQGVVHGAAWSKKGEDEKVECREMVEPDVLTIQKHWFNINYGIPASVTAELLDLIENDMAYEDVRLGLRLYERSYPESW